MNKGNMIDISKIGSFEITIAKCGLLRLNAIAYPTINSFAYEIKSDNEIIRASGDLHKAIEIYNSLVQ